LQGEGFLKTLDKRASGTAIDFQELRMESPQRGLGCLVVRMLMGPVDSAFKMLLLLLGKVAQHVLPFVILTALYDRILAEDVYDGLTQPLRPVDDEEQSFAEVQASINKISQQPSDRVGVLGGRLDKAQGLLSTILGHAKTNDHLLLRQVFSVDNEREDGWLLQGPCFELLPYLGRGLHRLAAHRRLAPPKAVEHHPTDALVVVRTQPQQHRFSQPLIGFRQLPQSLVVRKWHRGAFLPIPHTGYIDGNFLASDANASWIETPANVPPVMRLLSVSASSSVFRVGFVDWDCFMRGSSEVYLQLQVRGGTSSL